MQWREFIISTEVVDMPKLTKVAEIRRTDDAIIIYTNSIKLYDKLSTREDCLNVIPYMQEHGNKCATIGYDLYFPKLALAELKHILKQEGLTS